MTKITAQDINILSLINKMNKKQFMVEPVLQGQNYRVGNFVFKSTLTKAQVKELIKNNQKNIIKAHAAYSFDQKQIQSIRVMLQFCVQWDHSIVSFNDCNYRGFFYQIKDMSLPQLRVLSLQQNNINSIQLIQRMDSPLLDCIYLHGNPIVTIKSFRKCRFDRITRFYISVSDNEFYSEAYFPLLQTIQNYPKTEPKFVWKKYNSLRWIAKIESQKLRRILSGTEAYADKMCIRQKKALQHKNKKMFID